MIGKKFYCIQTARVVNSKDVFGKGSNLDHDDEFLPIFQIPIFVKLTIFLMLSVSALNTIVATQLNCVKKMLWRNLALVNLKLIKINFFTQSPTKIFCINVFIVVGCLASCLTLRPFSIPPENVRKPKVF